MAILRTTSYYPIFAWLVIAIFVLLVVLVMQFIYEFNEIIEQINIDRKLSKLFSPE